MLCLALSRGAQERPRCPSRSRPEPYAGEHGVDVSWRAVCVHRGHQDGPAGIRCRGKEQREGKRSGILSLQTGRGFPCNSYSQHSSLQHGWRGLNGRAPPHPWL